MGYCYVATRKRYFCKNRCTRVGREREREKRADLENTSRIAWRSEAELDFVKNKMDNFSPHRPIMRISYIFSRDQSSTLTFSRRKIVISISAVNTFATSIIHGRRTSCLSCETNVAYIRATAKMRLTNFFSLYSRYKQQLATVARDTNIHILLDVLTTVIKEHAHFQS